MGDKVEWTFPGSRWWQCDLHTHTPASSTVDFYSDPSASAADWVKAVLGSGVRVVAVTDHNTHRWIGEIQAAAEGTELVVFPGVEITVNGGIHVLAVLPVGTPPDGIAALLGECIPYTKFGKQDACSTLSFVEVAALIDKHHGLCLAAHADGKDGFLTQLVTFGPNGKPSGSQTLRQIVTSPHLRGVEVAGANPGLLAFIDDSKSDYRRSDGPLPLLEGSDAHGLAQLGRRSTWIKMAQPDLEGLRLALLDGELSIRRGSTVRDNPNQHAEDVIESIEIADARFIGRGQPCLVSLNPWLNTIIGGHGTGKSSLVEFLRIAMRRTDEVKALGDELADELEKYARVATSREDRGLLTPATILRVIIRRQGQRFRVQWSPDGRLTPIEQEGPDGVWAPAPGDVRSRFPVRIFSQKQIYRMAEKPNALLAIIDESPDVAAASLRAEIEREEKEFLALRARQRSIAAELSDEARLRGTLDDVRRKIALFEASEHREVLTAYQSVERQQQALDRWAASFAEAVARLEAVPDDLAGEDLQHGVFPETPDPQSAEGVVLAAMAEANARLAGVRRDTEALVGRAREALAAFRHVVSGETWSGYVAAARTRYEALKQRLLVAGAGDPSEYGRLVQERSVVESRLRDMAGRRTAMDDAGVQAAGRLVRAARLRSELTERRKQFVDRVLGGNNGQVRMTIVPHGDHRDAEDRLRDAIEKDDRFREDIWSEDDRTGLLRDLYCTAPPADPPAGFLAGLATLKHRLIRVAGGASDPDLHGKFQAHLRKLRPEALDRLEAFFPEDAIIVEYRGPGDDDFRSITEGSPGQKSAAVLAFLLSHGTEPLVLDQPEDDLDNQLISELIVAQLRQVKARRQLLVVTHNANIVVNADAELILPLVARSGQTHLEAARGLQDRGIRQMICDVMEGGRRALDQRYRRIRGGADHV